MRYVVACDRCNREKDVDGPEELAAVVPDQAQTVRLWIQEIFDANIPGTLGVGIIFTHSCPVCDTKREHVSYEFKVVRIKT